MDEERASGLLSEETVHRAKMGGTGTPIFMKFICRAEIPVARARFGGLFLFTAKKQKALIRGQRFFCLTAAAAAVNAILRSRKAGGGVDL
jgi:hypothetical protein